ncbi:AraC family transcriptional regulator [Actinomadura bangladeshensis]|jgi:AraC-like DNA-binding protein|uniref:Helix-turn-helix domain-containing protein n=1 Tax=Actinomadura bangladeshensis TaxID=453573 RepID=A0A6L9QGU1_9ACTN|nr:AraC family transcriptional regulator ligand-binding domain-containing protein [Actinomadura bangladeshensis]NEA24637.1 helix-turn-helix domain-containing protein [Actinomadura bangladeshensis]
MTQGTVSTALVRFVLGSLRGLGADSDRLAGQVGLPVWALGDDRARVPTLQLSRLWRLASVELDDPRLGLRMARQWSHGRLHLNDYLFETASTLGEGLSTAVRYGYIVSDSTGANDVDVLDENDRVTFRYQVRTPFPEVDALGSEFSLGVLLYRARRTLGIAVSPSHVGFTTGAPRSRRDRSEAFGTDRVDFGQEQTTMTFARSDLALPLPGADLGLAAVLRAHADSIVPAPPRAVRWHELLRQSVAARLQDRAVSVAAVARELAMSPRSLQRRLEEEGTNWRAEVDAVRREEAVRMQREGISRSAMAARLGYSDARALRRAFNRWNLRGT